MEPYFKLNYTTLGIDFSYSSSGKFKSVKPERKTHRTKVVPVIRRFPRTDKDIVTGIRKVPKADKESKVSVLKP